MQALHTEPGFSSSLDVRDKGHHYEVDAYLPGAEINNVKVTAGSNNLLRVTASQSKQQKKTTEGGEINDERIRRIFATGKVAWPGKDEGHENRAQG